MVILSRGHYHPAFLRVGGSRFHEMSMAQKKYDDLSKEELVRLLESRDRRDATRFGLVWEANEIERDMALNADFVALDLDADLSCPKNAGGVEESHHRREQF